MTNHNYDTIIIGGGSNGLIAAAYLAKAGQRVLVLEQRDTLGGTGGVEQFAPGFCAEAVPQAGGWLPEPIIRDLNLTRHGLNRAASNPTVFTPLPDGNHLLLWQEIGKSAEEIRRHSKRDVDRWADFTRFVARITRIFEDAYLITPPDGLNVSPGELPELASLALKVRGLGDREMVEFLKVLPMSAQEFFEDWFESEALRATLAASGISGIQQGPRAAGTTFVFLHHHVGAKEGSFRAVMRQKGGSLGDVLAAAAKAHGATIRSGARVAQIISSDSVATGVILENGEEIRAKRVVSSLDPSATFLNMVDPLEMPTSFVRAVRNIKYRGAAAMVHLALGERPDFTALPGDGPHLRGTISIGPDMEYLERASDAAKYGEISAQPVLEISIPSLSDPSLAPAGQHVMSIRAQYAPYHLRDGEWDDAKREALLDTVLEALTPYAPNVKSAIQHYRVITPKDLEETYGLTQGSLNHGEMMLDQLYFMRPVPGWSQYRSPVERLYLCGAGTHPGGGVIGVPAYNGVREILRDK